MNKYLLATAAALALATTPALAGNTYMGVDASTTKVDDLDTRSTGWNVYGGYRFSDSFAIEAGYRSLINKTVQESGVSVKAKGSALQASALMMLPLTADTSFFARLGVNRLAAKASASGFTAKDSETKAVYGIGLDHALSSSIALRIEAQRPASGTDVLSAGVKFNF